MLVDYELLCVVIMNGVGRTNSNFSTSFFDFDFGFDYVAKAKKRYRNVCIMLCCEFY